MIAIKGHLKRGKEVIRILESLGGINKWNQTGEGVNYAYYIDHANNIYSFGISGYHGNRKIYTLEEFEKSFPFKIGDKVTIVGIPDFPKTITKMEWDCDEILYSFEGLVNTWFGVKALKKFEMKEERNITLTLDKAKEWYNKGGELKEIALQAFTEKELNPLPRSWEEFCNQGNPIVSWKYRIPIKYEALFKLEQLRDCWRNGWKPEWNDDQQAKYCIIHSHEFKIHILYETNRFLSFPTKEMAEEFLECFKDLIKQAGDLI